MTTQGQFWNIREELRGIIAKAFGDYECSMQDLRFNVGPESVVKNAREARAREVFQPYAAKVAEIGSITYQQLGEIVSSLPMNLNENMLAPAIYALLKAAPIHNPEGRFPFGMTVGKAHELPPGYFASGGVNYGYVSQITPRQPAVQLEMPLPESGNISALLFPNGPLINYGRIPPALKAFSDAIARGGPVNIGPPVPRPDERSAYYLDGRGAITGWLDKAGKEHRLK